MAREKSHTLTVDSKICIGLQFNAICRLRETLADLDAPFIKYASLCDLDYTIMDVMDLINCVADCCFDETRSIIDDKGLIALGELKKVLHKVRHSYCYGEENSRRRHNNNNCTGNCYDYVCTCRISIPCIDCEVRISFHDCEPLIDKVYTLLTNAINKYTGKNGT